jgi:hypothetical protein
VQVNQRESYIRRSLCLSGLINQPAVYRSIASVYDIQTENHFDLRFSSLFHNVERSTACSGGFLRSCKHTTQQLDTFARAAQGIEAMKVTSLAVVLCAVGVNSSVEIVVNHFEDGTGPQFGCSSDTEQCNLRSAWMQCSAYLDEPCIVRLPFDSYHTFNSTIGQLELKDGLDIAILGSNSTVAGFAPHIQTVIENEDFPLETGLLLETNSASQNVAWGCVEACPQDVLRFSACDGGGRSDTYFRLFDSSQSEMGRDDDGCGIPSGPSTITYFLPENSACQQYCLHVGCFSDHECSANVTLQLIKAPQPPARLLSFMANNDNTGPLNGRLFLYGLVIQGFTALNGGVVHSSGDLDLTIYNCAFRESAGFYGGAIYITNNSLAVYIASSVFDTSTAAVSGGAIFVGKDVTQLTIDGCTFYYCSADGSEDGDGGGAVYLGGGNHDAVIYDVTIWGCSAPLGSGGGVYTTSSDGLWVEGVSIRGCSAKFGGGVEIDSGCNDVLIRNVQVSQTSAVGYGGAISIWEANQRVRLVAVSIDQCTAGISGGGLYINNHNSFVSFSNLTVARCTALRGDGGGLQLYQENVNITMESTAIKDCSAASLGGGISVEDRNDFLSLWNVRIIGCVADLGGGLAVYQNNVYVSLLEVEFELCGARTSGGGMYVSVDNPHLFLRDVRFSGCVARYGGGITLQSHNAGALVRGLVIDQCSASLGGGMFMLSGNDFLSLSETTIVACTAGIRGGAMYVHADNNFLSLTKANITRCFAQSDGGGLYLYQDNLNATLDSVVIDECQAGNIGGGIMALQRNNFFLLRHATFAVCVAGQAGGGLQMGQGNVNVTLENVLIEDCTAGTFGGGMDVVSGNDHLLLRDVVFAGCDAIYGGGISLSLLNRHVLLERVKLDDCWATYGGGMYMLSQNDFMSLSEVQITRCDSITEGGGMFSFQNDYLLITESHVEHCTAGYAGGGLTLYKAHSVVHIVGSSILYNAAGNFGGGISSQSATRDLIIAGTVLRDNYATISGGGIFLGSEHAGFQILSEKSYRYWTVIETEHPYQYSQQLVINQTVVVPDAMGYYIFLDARTQLDYSDNCELYGYSDQEDSFGAADGSITFTGDAVAAPGVDSPPRLVLWPSVTLTCTTPLSSVGKNYYGVRVNIVPVFADVVGATLLQGNGAGDYGGGLHMHSNVQFPVMVGARFCNNVAGVGGGGMYLRNGVTGMVAYQLTFDGNSADGNGGGACVSTTSYGLEFNSCNFTGNSAGGAGGGLAYLQSNYDGTAELLYSNDNTIVRSAFSHNTAAGGGGALYLGTNCALWMMNSTVANNTAHVEGGGIALSLNSFLTAEFLTISGNRAGECGGGISLGASCGATIRNSSVSENAASGQGGAFCAKQGSGFDISNTEVLLNRAERGGGALCCLASREPKMRNTVIANNVARWGSVLYLESVDFGINSRASNVTIAENSARVGTIYWVNGTMPEPTQFLSSFELMRSMVQFGQEVATQATALRAPNVITVWRYSDFLDPLVLTLLDWYGEVSPASGSASVQVSILEESTLQCNGRPPFLSGGDVSSGGVYWQEGVAVLSSLGVTCYPGSNVTLLFTAHLTDQVDLPAEQQTMSAVTILHFRSCQEGEYIGNGKCAVCPSGSYSLKAKVVDATSCTECLSKGSVVFCQGANIVLKEGYWRRHPDSEAILPCLDAVDGCAGGNITGDPSCREGHEGPLCSVCSEAHYLSDARCVACRESDRLAPASVLYVIIAVVVVGAVLVVLFYKSSRMYSGDAPSVWESLYNVVSWLIDELQSLQSQIKILITTFQICTAMRVSMKVKFPLGFTRYLNAMSVVNLNVVALVPLTCAARANYTFIDKLVMVTLGPIALSLLIALIGAVEYQRCAYRSRGDDNMTEALNKVTSRYLTMFLFLTYLVLPYVATTIFQTFLCTNVDPQSNDTDASDLYLTADMRISCDSDYYRSGVGYASVMAVLYVGGIPLMYALLLYRSRHEIAGRFIAPPSTEGETAPPDTIAACKLDAESAGIGLETGAGEKVEGVTAEEPENHLVKRTDAAALQARMISFLYEAYEPQYWYWEVVETTRRLVLTAVLSVCGAGTGGQAVLALLLAYLYIKLYGHFRPYKEDADDLEAEVGQHQIFLTILGALICQRQLLGDGYHGAVDGVLLAINTSVTVMFTRNVLIRLREDVKNLRNFAQVFPKLHTVSSSYMEADLAPNKEAEVELAELGDISRKTAAAGTATFAGEKVAVAGGTSSTQDLVSEVGAAQAFSGVEVYKAAEDHCMEEEAVVDDEVV